MNKINIHIKSLYEEMVNVLLDQITQVRKELNESILNNDTEKALKVSVELDKLIEQYYKYEKISN